MGRTGAVTPVAELETIPLSGTKVSRATLHNAGYIEEKDIREGDTVLVEKAGEIIPAVLGVVLEKRPENSVPFVFPAHCPECGSELKRYGEKMLYRCPNLSCPPQVLGRLEHFASRNCMDIRGLGDKIARTLHKQGATLALTDRNAEKMEKLKAELGGNVECFVADLGNSEAISQLIKDVEAKFGRIDILVNNAGLTRDNLFIRMSDEEWQLVLDVNLTAGFKLAKAAVRGMMKRRFGRIIGIASVVGVTGNAGQANYSASKAGMIAMNKCLAQEVGSRGITVNSIAPGFIRTPMTDVLPDDVKAALLAKIPEGKLGEAQDIANVVAFLASDEAQYITGQTININGGMAMI